MTDRKKALQAATVIFICGVAAATRFGQVAWATNDDAMKIVVATIAFLTPLLAGLAYARLQRNGNGTKL